MLSFNYSPASTLATPLPPPSSSSILSSASTCDRPPPLSSGLDTCDMTCSYARTMQFFSFVCVIWIHIYVWYDVFCMCDVCYSYVWHDVCYLYVCHDSFISLPYPLSSGVHRCDVPRSNVCDLNLHICVMWCTHMCDVLHSYVWHDSFARVICSFIVRVIRVIHVCDMSHSYTGTNSHTCTHKYTCMHSNTHAYSYMHSTYLHAVHSNIHT